MNIPAFGTDEKLELKGVWKRISSDARILVARANNTAYVNFVRSETDDYKGAFSSMSSDVAEEIVIKATAKAILLDWEGLTDEEGVEVPHSEDKAIEWLTKYKEFRKIVLSIANDVDNYKISATKEVQENIKKQ